MRFDMLNEINKELLHEIGICAIGDVLSILKHVKKLTTNQIEIKVKETKNVLEIQLPKVDVQKTGVTKPNLTSN
jgi:hypothetical protein